MKLNLCCGMDYREGYINIDFSEVGSDGKPIKVDQKVNILEGLPYENNSVDEVVFRESLEHFQKNDGFNVLKEIYRVLKKGGKLDLSVPNAPRQLKILLAFCDRPVTYKEFLNPHQSPWGYLKYHEDLMGASHATFKDGKYIGGEGDLHKTLYTKSFLKMVLTQIGFEINEFKEDSSFFVVGTK